MLDLTKYLNLDGTYTSPKNGKTYKSLKAFKAHWSNPGTGGWKNINNTKKECQYCSKKVNLPNLVKHETICYLNPSKTKFCKVCNKPIKNYKSSKGTCSHSCSNKLFAHLRNKPEKYSRYQTICFTKHKKECIICGENKIVAVHHLNEDHNDNRIENLIPLCPTHHQYMHSKYKELIEEKVIVYITEWKKINQGVA